MTSHRHSSNTLFVSHSQASEHQEAEKKKIWILLRKCLIEAYEQNKENPKQGRSIEDIAETIKPLMRRGELDKLLNANPVYSLLTLRKQILANEIGFEEPEPFRTIEKWINEGLLAELTLPKTLEEPAIVPEKFYETMGHKQLMTDLVESKVGWRLFVDGTKQRGETAASYDTREPGCVLAMAKAFKHAMTHVDMPLTFDEIITLHKLCLEGVKELNEDALSGEPFRQSDQIVGFGITEVGEGKTKTINGYRELCLYNGIDKDYTVRCDRVQAILYGKALEKRINHILKHYEEVMKDPMSKEKKLQNIVILVALLERIHPFWDANCRTLCIMVLNKELVRHGFPLTILEDPNRFDSFSANELMNEVINGFANYEHVKKHHCFPGEEVTSKTGKAESADLIDAIEEVLSSLKVPSLTRRI